VYNDIGRILFVEEGNKGKIIGRLRALPCWRSIGEGDGDSLTLSWVIGRKLEIGKMKVYKDRGIIGWSKDTWNEWMTNEMKEENIG